MNSDSRSSPPRAAGVDTLSARDQVDEIPPAAGSSPLGVPKMRQCLTCQGAFQSEWSGERVCRRCKTKSGWRQGRQAGGGSSRSR